MIWLGIVIGLAAGFVLGARAALSYARHQLLEFAGDRILAASFKLGTGDKNVPPHVFENLKRMRKEQGLP